MPALSWFEEVLLRDLGSLVRESTFHPLCFDKISIIASHWMNRTQADRQKGVATLTVAVSLGVYLPFLGCGGSGAEGGGGVAFLCGGRSAGISLERSR